MNAPVEISIDLTAQELVSPPPLGAMVEVEDVCAIDPLLNTGSFVANVENPYDDAPIELELSAEDLDAFLEGRLKL